MKILIVSQYFYPETFRVNTLAKELVKRGNEVTVLTGYPQYPKGEIFEGYGFNVPYETEWNGVKIERIKVSPRGHSIIGMLKNCITFVTEGNKWVKRCKERYDAIYVFEVSPVTVGLPAVKYKKKYGTPIYFNVQDLWPENVEEVLGIRNSLVIGVINKIVDRIYKNSDKILCSSNGFVDNIKQRGVEENKIVFWPQFCEKPQVDNASKPECYSNDYFNIVFTGNIGEAQGLELLIEAADKLKNDKVRWYIVGDGRARERLVQLVKDKGLTKNVYFMGRVSEHEANIYVRYADCAYLSFVNCKLFDLTIPAKLQTYLANGTPILGAVSGESADIIRKFNCGRVVKKEADDVYKTVKELMSLDKGMIEEMRNASKRCYAENFDMNKLIQELESMMNMAK